MAKFKLKLYVLGNTPVAKRAIENLKTICEMESIADNYEPVVIALLDQPKLADTEKILATPLLIKDLPEPIRRIIGDLSDHDRVLVGLDLYEQ